MELRCSDLGSSCSYVAKGDSEGEVLDDMWDHAEEMHEEALEGDEEDIKEEWRKHIRK